MSRSPGLGHRPGHIAWLLASALAVSATPAWPQVHDHGGTTSAPSTSTPSGAKPPPQQAAWKAANEAVGAFPRGHADILRWEQSRASPQTAEMAKLPEPWTLPQSIAAAMRAQPGLLAQPGLNPQEAAALRNRTLALSHQVERAWVQAVAARQGLAYQRQVLEAAEAGTELARRMTQVGNWSAARQMREELALWDAQAQWLLAQQQEQAATEALWRLLDSTAPDTQALPDHLPTQLPPLPASLAGNSEALQQQALQQHPRWPWLDRQARLLVQGLTPADRERLTRLPQEAIAAAQGQWPARMETRGTGWSHALEKAAEAQAEAAALERQIRSDVRLALTAWQTARALAVQARQEVQRLHTALQEETLLRYNGMLASTWDLLAAARTRVTSVHAALQAERDAWLAHADLQAVLNGLPYAGASLGAAGTSAAPTPAGH
ncbi:TolC family protein [Hydrogenophaga aquatica]